MASPTLPETSPLLILSLPTSSQNILLVTLNRPEKLNSIPSHGHREMESVWQWMDQQPDIRCAILVGKGRAFCAGADLEGECHQLCSFDLDESCSITRRPSSLTDTISLNVPSGLYFIRIDNLYDCILTPQSNRMGL